MCNGDNDSGQCDVPVNRHAGEPLITTGSKHSCYSNSIYVTCWGDNRYGQLNLDFSYQQVKALKAAEFSTCYYSYNEFKCIGQIKILKKYEIYYPNISISYGGDTICNIKFNANDKLFNKLDCFGECRNNMCKIPNNYIFGVSQVSTGHDHVCALSILLSNKNYLSCWGGDLYGQSSIPTGSNLYISTFTAGNLFTCVARSNGHVFCVGLINDNNFSIPSEVIDYVSYLSIGLNHTCVVQNGKPNCIGDNEHNQSLIDKISNDSVIIKASYYYTCEIRINSKFICWGSNSLGLIDGYQKWSKLQVSYISVSINNVCIISNDKPYCWGNKINTNFESIPYDTSAIEEGINHRCLLAKDTYDMIAEKVYCYGSNELNQLEVDSTIWNVWDLSAGYNHSCIVAALILESSRDIVYCWGSDSAGQVTVPAMETDSVMNVSAAADHTCGVYVDARLVCWGMVSVKGKYNMDKSRINYVVAGPNQNCLVSLDGKYECQESHEKVEESKI